MATSIVDTICFSLLGREKQCFGWKSMHPIEHFLPDYLILILQELFTIYKFQILTNAKIIYACGLANELCALADFLLGKTSYISHLHSHFNIPEAEIYLFTLDSLFFLESAMHFTIIIIF